MPLTKQPDSRIVIHACRHRGGCIIISIEEGHPPQRPTERGVRYLRVLSLLLSHSPLCNLLNILKI